MGLFINCTTSCDLKVSLWSKSHSSFRPFYGSLVYSTWTTVYITAAPSSRDIVLRKMAKSRRNMSTVSQYLAIYPGSTWILKECGFLLFYHRCYAHHMSLISFSPLSFNQRWLIYSWFLIFEIANTTCSVRLFNNTSHV